MKYDLSKNVSMLTPVDLQNLIPAAQAHDQNAIDRLCKAFEPLIYKEAYRSYVIQNLGKEDAVNTAWEIFLEFVMSYQGKHFRLLPGLIKQNLRGKLLNKILRQYSVKSSESLENQVSDNEAMIFNPMLILTEQQQLTNALQRLTFAERRIITDIYLNGYSLSEISRKYGCKIQSCHNLKERGLKKLKQYLTE